MSHVQLSIPRALIYLLILAALLTAPAAAQDELQFEDLVEVSEILLDVLVTDRKGHVVTGLQAKDFVIEEEGQRVPLTGASFYTTSYDVREGLPVTTDAAKEIPWSRFFIVFIHDQRAAGSIGNRLLQQQHDAGRKLREWVEEEMLPSDWMAVVSWSFKLRIHQDFTQDREALDRALEGAALGRDPGQLSPSERARAISSGPSLYRYLPSGPELDRQTKRIYKALREISDATGYIVGRKNLMLFTIGFGDDFGGSYFSLPDPRFYPELEQSLNHHNVAVYPIDLTPPLVEHTQSAVLAQLARDTGGRYHFNFIDFRTPLRRISEENVGYYLLSYQTEHPAGESGYREIRVRTSNKKLRVQTRRGYRYGGGE